MPTELLKKGLRQRNEALQAENADLEARVQQLEAEAAVARAANVVVGHTAADLHMVTSELTRLNNALQFQNDIPRDMPSMLERIAAVFAANKALKARIRNLEAKLQVLKAKIQGLKEENVTLKEGMKMLIEKDKRRDEVENRREALLTLHDVVAAVKADKTSTIARCFKALDECGSDDDEDTYVSTLAARFFLSPEEASTIVKLRDLNTEHDDMSHSRLRSFDDMERLYERAQHVFRSFANAELESANYASNLFAQRIAQANGARRGWKH